MVIVYLFLVEAVKDVRQIIINPLESTLNKFSDAKSTHDYLQDSQVTIQETLEDIKKQLVYISKKEYTIDRTTTSMIMSLKDKLIQDSTLNEHSFDSQFRKVEKVESNILKTILKINEDIPQIIRNGFTQMQDLLMKKSEPNFNVSNAEFERLKNDVASISKFLKGCDFNKESTENSISDKIGKYQQAQIKPNLRISQDNMSKSSSTIFEPDAVNISPNEMSRSISISQSLDSIQNTLTKVLQILNKDHYEKRGNDNDQIISAIRMITNQTENLRLVQNQETILELKVKICQISKERDELRLMLNNEKSNTMNIKKCASNDSVLNIFKKPLLSPSNSNHLISN
jgi:hypothetical protein